MHPAFMTPKTLLGAHSLSTDIAFVVKNLTEVGTLNMIKKMGFVPKLGPTQHALMLHTRSASILPILSFHRKLLQIFVFLHLFSHFIFRHLSTEKVINQGPQFSKLFGFSRRDRGGL